VVLRDSRSRLPQMRFSVSNQGGASSWSGRARQSRRKQTIVITAPHLASFIHSERDRNFKAKVMSRPDGLRIGTWRRARDDADSHSWAGGSADPGHALLSRQFRVVAVECPDSSVRPANSRTRNRPEWASTMDRGDRKARSKASHDGTSLAARPHCGLTLQQRKTGSAVILEAPARSAEGSQPPSARRGRGSAGSICAPGAVAALPDADPRYRRRPPLVMRLRRGRSRPGSRETVAGAPDPTRLFGTSPRA